MSFKLENRKVEMLNRGKVLVWDKYHVQNGGKPYYEMKRRCIGVVWRRSDELTVKRVRYIYKYFLLSETLSNSQKWTRDDWSKAKQIFADSKDYYLEKWGWENEHVQKALEASAVEQTFFADEELPLEVF